MKSDYGPGLAPKPYFGHAWSRLSEFLGITFRLTLDCCTDRISFQFVLQLLTNTRRHTLFFFVFSVLLLYFLSVVPHKRFP